MFSLDMLDAMDVIPYLNEERTITPSLLNRSPNILNDIKTNFEDVARLHQTITETIATIIRASAHSN